MGLAKRDKSSLEFIDMSVKEPWEEKWKTKCRTRIKGCNGFIMHYILSMTSLVDTGSDLERSECTILR